MLLVANVVAIPATLLFCAPMAVMNAAFWKPFAADTPVAKNLEKIGSGTVPCAGKRFAKLFVTPFAILIARLFWAFRNSFKNPFSKMLTSLMSCARSCAAWHICQQA